MKMRTGFTIKKKGDKMVEFFISNVGFVLMTLLVIIVLFGGYLGYKLIKRWFGDDDLSGLT